MNTDMTGFRCQWFSKSLRPCVLDENNLTTGKVMENSICIFDICVSKFGYKNDFTNYL